MLTLCLTSLLSKNYNASHSARKELGEDFGEVTQEIKSLLRPNLLRICSAGNCIQGEDGLLNIENAPWIEHILTDVIGLIMQNAVLNFKNRIILVDNYL